VLKTKIEALRRKQERFEEQGDLSRANHCKIIADYLQIEHDLKTAVGGAIYE
jgi:hypothetical protein